MNIINMKNLLIAQAMLATLVIINTFSFSSINYELGTAVYSNVFIWYVQMGFYFSLIFLHACEYLFCLGKKRPIIRTLVISFGALLIAETGTLSISKMNYMLLLVVFIYACFLLGRILKDMILKMEPPVSHLQPVNSFFTPRGYKQFQTGYIIIILGVIIFFFFGKLPLPERLVYSFLIIFYYRMIIPFIQQIKIPIWLNRYYHNLDFEKLTIKINEQRRNNLHPESRAFIDLLETHIELGIDENKAMEMFTTIEKPQFPNYRYLYNLVVLEVALAKKDYVAFDESFKNALPNFKYNPVLIRNFKKLKMVKELWQNGVTNIKMETEFALKHKVLFEDLNNASVLAKYHFLKGNTAEAEKYRRFVMEKGQKLPQLIKDTESEEFIRRT